MSSQWTDIIHQICPEYDKICQILEQGPTVKLRLIQRAHQWAVYCEEFWSDLVRNHSDTRELDKRIDWCADELSKWPCFRSSYDTWIFDSKREAEKFITLFNLKWPT